MNDLFRFFGIMGMGVVVMIVIMFRIGMIMGVVMGMHRTVSVRVPVFVMLVFHYESPP